MVRAARVVIATAALACGPHAEVRTWTAAPATEAGKSGRVMSVREVAAGEGPSAGAGGVIGGVIGGVMFTGVGWSTLVGIVLGGVTGAVLTPSPPPPPTYEVRVRFDDGSARTLEYHDVAPFTLGQRVVIDNDGVVRGESS